MFSETAKALQGTDGSSSSGSRQESMRIELKQYFPVSKLFIVKDSIGWIFGGAALLGLLLWLDQRGVMTATEGSLLGDLNIEINTFVYAIVIVLAVKLVYSALERRFCNYYLERGHLVITRGVLIRHNGRYPLAQITDVYSSRDYRDLALGLHTIVICTPTNVSEDFARIHGLRTKTSEQLALFILSAVENYQLPNQRRVEAASSMKISDPFNFSDSEVKLNPPVGVQLLLPTRSGEVS